MVEVPPVRTRSGFAEQEITGGRGSFTVNLPLQDAKPFFLPSLKLAVTPYEPGCKLVVSICTEASLPVTFTPVPFQVYLTVRLGPKFDPLAVAVTDSPAKASVIRRWPPTNPSRNGEKRWLRNVILGPTEKVAKPVSSIFFWSPTSPLPQWSLPSKVIPSQWLKLNVTLPPRPRGFASRRLLTGSKAKARPGWLFD